MTRMPSSRHGGVAHSLRPVDAGQLTERGKQRRGVVRRVWRDRRVQHRCGAQAVNETGRGVQREKPAIVDDAHPVGELGRLVHVVGGEHDRDAPLAQVPDPVPDEQPGVRIQAGGRLVEEEHRRLVHQ